MINRSKLIKKSITFILIIIVFVSLYSFKAFEASLSQLYSFFSNTVRMNNSNELSLEINNLREIIATITIDEARIQALEDENQKLREFLDFSESNDLNLVLSNVIARQSVLGINSQEQNLIIDKGRQDGIQEGLVVLSEVGSIVGKVIQVKEKNSLVCLLNNRNCQLAVGILNEDKTLGLVEGEKGLSIKMSLIPQTENIQVDDIVVSSGLDNLVPRNLALGRVYKIEKRGNDIWQSAFIEPAILFDNLSILAIVLP